MAITSAQVQQLYVAYLGRAADKAGLDYWLNELNGSTTAPATLTLENLRANFVNEQPEYTAAYAGLTRSETVSKIYLQLFGHSADAAGLAYWTTGGGATVNTDQLLVAFVNGASATDAKIVANKVLVAEVYTSTAGTNYAAADAKSILVDVGANYGTVTDALNDLSALPGIALPANVASIKADVAANAAKISYETSKVASLVSLNDKVVALNAGYNASLLSVKDGADANTTVDYAEAYNAVANASALLTAILDGDTIDTLKTQVTTDTTALTTARANLVSNDAQAVAKINTYNAAVAADAKLVEVDGAAVTTAEASLTGVLTVGANKTAFDAAATSYKTASGSDTTIATSADLYAALKGAAGDSAKIAQLDTAFNTGAFASSYGTLKTLSATDAAKTAAGDAVDTAAAAVGNAYASAATTLAADTKVLADAQAAQALVDTATAETTAHDAVVATALSAHIAVTGNATIHDIDAGVIAADVPGTTAELFYFSAIKASDDVIVTNFAKGDALYVGDGLTFNSSVTIGTDGFAVGTSTSAKEIYFTKGTDGVVSVNIETNAVGQTAGTTGADNVAVIKLAGITDLSEVSYANGVISTTHAAVVA